MKRQSGYYICSKCHSAAFKSIKAKEEHEKICDGQVKELQFPSEEERE